MPETTPTPVSIQSIPTSQLKPNPWNRTVFDPQAIEEIAESAKAGGIREPLLVRPLPEGGFQIASGHRRWLAAQKAGLPEVPCLVQALADEQVAEDNITLNVQREQIPPLELARMVSRYMKDFKKTQEVAAQKFGKSQAWVSEQVRFTQFPPEVMSIITAVIIGVRGLRALKDLPDELQLQVAKELKEEKITSEGVEKRCLELGGGKKSVRKGQKQPKDAIPDPLADFWPQVQALTKAGVAGSWQVQYKEGSWQFTFKPLLDNTPKSDIGRWFRSMGDLLLGAASGEAQIPSSLSVPTMEEKAAEEQFKRFAPSTPEEMGRAAEDMAKAQVPTTQEQEAALLDIAKAAIGPAVVYEHILGVGNFYSERFRGVSWEEAGYKDAETGCREILSDFRAMAEFAQNKL